MSISTGLLSNQVFEGKGSDQLIPVEDLGDNEFKGSPHPLQGHLHFNAGLTNPQGCKNYSNAIVVVEFSVLRQPRREMFMGLMNLLISP